ncbi:HNH endonuclease [Flexivirga caeni]|uniref:HNH endonuclease n=2 Tax=Flexivirga caeni TaxID=2294115 RepID=A0A3M9MJ66_9MICO|nr:HNH endonuclease [Flexivirga caeni]
MESRARTYPGLLAHLIKLRDHTCRTPFCIVTIRHIDHIRPHATGGETTERDGQGLCARCNYLKEHPDYTVTGDAGETTTSTGSLVATSHPPSPPGLPPPTRHTPNAPSSTSSGSRTSTEKPAELRAQ